MFSNYDADRFAEAMNAWNEDSVEDEPVDTFVTLEELVESFITDVQCNCDGSFQSLLRVAATYRQAVLERVCQTKRRELVQDARIDVADVDRLDSIVRLSGGCTKQVLIDRCARIILLKSLPFFRSSPSTAVFRCTVCSL